MLPPKDPHEEKKHLQEYESMMKQAKKLEAKKQRESNRKREEKDKKASYAIYTWENDIIPHWKSRIKDKRTMVLWDQGIPPRCRKKVWCLKIGNQLNITKNTFSECTRRVPQAVRNNSKTAIRMVRLCLLLLQAIIPHTTLTTLQQQQRHQNKCICVIDDEEPAVWMC